jgi:N6-L-threonylcarbamoyladenine synthase
MLGLGYPGGPAIQRAAEGGAPHRFNFPRARLDTPWDFSFSGLKTAVLREVRGLEKKSNTLPVTDLAASFQAAVVDVLYEKTMDAAREFRAEEILVAGGVSANQVLRNAFLNQNEFKVHIPPISKSTDNAAQNAPAAYSRYAHDQTSTLDMDVQATWPLS